MKVATTYRLRALAWLNVVLLGALTLALVFGLHLYPRLDAGQRAVQGLKPVFVPARITGDTTGINFVGAVVNAVDPLMTSEGTGASEVPKLIALVSAQSGLTQAAVLSTLQAQFPHTTALLEALPLSSVTAELPGFLAFVAQTLAVSTAQLATILQSQFPHLTQALTNLPVVTNGWDSVPNLNGLTLFNGTPVKTAPQLQDYFAKDLVPVLTKNNANFDRVATYFPPLKDIPILLSAIGLIAVLYGLLMMLPATGGLRRKERAVAWTIVLLLGLVVLGTVFGARISVRIDGGSQLARDATPAYTPNQVAGARAGITFDSHVVDMADPIMNPQGGASAEIATLLATLEAKTKLSGPQLLATVSMSFPHTAALLQALPLSAANVELPGVLNLLHIVLNETPAEVVTTLQTNVPGLMQTITNLPIVVNGWYNSPGGSGLTRFDGSAVTTAPQLRDYLSGDVIAAVEATAPDFRQFSGPDLNGSAPMVTIIGVLFVFAAAIIEWDCSARRRQEPIEPQSQRVAEGFS